MKRLGFAVVSLVFAFAATPVWAQQGPGSGPGFMPGYGYGHMWGGEAGWHPGLFFGPVMMIFALVGFVIVIAWLVRRVGYGWHHGHGHGLCPVCGRGHGHGQGRGALDILEERFARGEIGKDEFEDKRKLLGR